MSLKLILVTTLSIAALLTVGVLVAPTISNAEKPAIAADIKTPAVLDEAKEVIAESTDKAEEAVVESVDQIKETLDNKLEKSTAVVKSPDGLEAFPIIGLGDPDAPVYLIEYASLSCSHCAEFHINILPRLKEDFIDNGQVYIEFRDFPTSQSALIASKIVHCMDEKRQYKFMDLLFQTQETWAFTEDTTPLYQNAKLAGMSGESIESCVSNANLEKTLLEAIQKGRSTYSISSTPTVVAFPTKEKLKGLHDYKTVKKQIQRALKSAEE